MQVATPTRLPFARARCSVILRDEAAPRWEGSRPDDERRPSPADSDPLVSGYRPRTPIGKALLEARRAYLEAGGRLLSEDELRREIEQRRGESSSS